MSQPKSPGRLYLPGLPGLPGKPRAPSNSVKPYINFGNEAGSKPLNSVSAKTAATSTVTFNNHTLERSDLPSVELTSQPLPDIFDKPSTKHNAEPIRNPHTSLLDVELPPCDRQLVPARSMLPLTHTIEVHRASVNKSYDRYVTSTVEGWRETFVLGNGTEHLDIIPGATIGRPGSRLTVFHPLQQSDCEGLDDDTISKIYSELDFIQWISHKHHTWLPETRTRTTSLRALSASCKTRISTQLIQREDDLSKRIETGEAAHEVQDRALSSDDVLPGKITKPKFVDLPEQLFINRLWRVLNGTRAGTWLCEQCERPHEGCSCPRALTGEPLIFEWRFNHYFPPGEGESDTDDDKRPETEEWAYVEWRGEGYSEMFLDRRQFGRHAADPQVYDMDYRKEDEEWREEEIDEIEKKISDMEHKNQFSKLLLQLSRNVRIKTDTTDLDSSPISPKTKPRAA